MDSLSLSQELPYDDIEDQNRLDEQIISNNELQSGGVNKLEENGRSNPSIKQKRKPYKPHAKSLYADNPAKFYVGKECPGFALTSTAGDPPKGVKIVNDGWLRNQNAPRMVVSQSCDGTKEANARMCVACAKARRTQQRKELRVFDRVSKLLNKEGTASVKAQLQWAPSTLLNELAIIAEKNKKLAKEAKKECDEIKQMYKGPLTNLMGRAERFIPDVCFARTYYSVSLAWISHVCNPQERGTRSWRWESVPDGKDFVEFFQTLRKLPHPKRMYDFMLGTGGTGAGKGNNGFVDLSKYNLPAVPPEKTLQWLSRKRQRQETQLEEEQLGRQLIDEMEPYSQEVEENHQTTTQSVVEQRHEVNDGQQHHENQQNGIEHDSQSYMMESTPSFAPRESPAINRREHTWIPPMPRQTDKSTEWVWVQRRKRDDTPLDCGDDSQSELPERPNKISRTGYEDQI